MTNEPQAAPLVEPEAPYCTTEEGSTAWAWGRKGWDAAQVQARRADKEARRADYAERTATTHALFIEALSSQRNALRAALAQRDREVLGLRQALEEVHSHHDADIYELGPILAATVQAGAEAERRIREDERRKITIEKANAGLKYLDEAIKFLSGHPHLRSSFGILEMNLRYLRATLGTGVKE